jgi:hypothetical protein
LIFDHKGFEIKEAVVGSAVSFRKKVKHWAIGETKDFIVPIGIFLDKEDNFLQIFFFFPRNFNKPSLW